MIPAAIQLGGSLVAIVLLAWLAGVIGLGGDIRLRDRDEAVTLARTAICDFVPVEIVLDRAGIGALLRDGEGQILLLRRHGVHFAARLISGHQGSKLDRNLLTVATGERFFGSVTLDLGPDAQIWASRLGRLGGDG